MRNPWLDLPSAGELVLPADRAAIEHHNQVVGDSNFRFVLDLLPEPFLGSPDADIVLLNLNPGFSEDDYAAHSNLAFAQACRLMLSHERTEWPFYLLDPRFSYASGAAWWRRRLRRLAEAVGAFEPLGHRLLVVELYGYHSRRFKVPKTTPPSVSYGIALVRHAMDRGALVVLMRAGAVWLSHLPELAAYERFHRLSNPQAPYFSPANAPTVFEEAVSLLRG